jgi:hypothetical protein
MTSFLGLMAGCSAAPPSDGVAAQSDELSVSRLSFVTLRPDTRRCHAPQCGGYWIRDVNASATTPETYVAALDFTKSGLDDATIAKVTSADATELVLNGRLSTLFPTTNTQNFFVFAAYRGLPQITYGATDVFYQAADFDPIVDCFAAPCPEGTATKLNKTTTVVYDRIDVSAAALSNVDASWLHAEVAQKNAVVAGKIVNGKLIAGRYEHVLAADQIFLKLPAQPGPCLAGPVQSCSGDTPVGTFSRNTNLCLVPTGCVASFACSHALPACADGYTRSSWNALPFGCPTYTCDPTFVVQ